VARCGRADLLQRRARAAPPRARQLQAPDRRAGAALHSRAGGLLWRHLARHEPCIARSAPIATAQFDVVTTVPSSDPRRDQHHPLRTIVGDLAAPTRERYELLLRRSAVPVNAHTFHREKYTPIRRLDGTSVLLIDDTWTTGANAQGAACALKSTGASTVAALVIGRHINRDWGENDARLRAGRAPFTWDECPYCEQALSA
jgi:hypothetical protein